MALQFISGIAQGLQSVTSPILSSPQPSPSPSRRFPGIIPGASSSSKQFFVEFATLDEPVGKVVIKVLEGAGRLGSEFESLITGKNGFGYKGSRVFACCQNEWCLMGDLLYDVPRPDKQQQHDWDPWDTDEGRDGVKSRREKTKSSEGEAPLRTLHHGYKGIVETQQETAHRDVPGAVVAVATDLDLHTRKWTLGPQFKLCLSDSLIRSGRVLGQVTSGMEVVQRVSQMSERGNFEPSARITIVDCGSC
ncbi:uncharacterized protein [Panulirus ornatus]|uniref:uncharacterized protein isoform X3 n=1 Tax=Panulirus ornatus TaxID=150431 RepID=UPI003A8A34D1